MKHDKTYYVNKIVSKCKTQNHELLLQLMETYGVSSLQEVTCDQLKTFWYNIQN